MIVVVLIPIRWVSCACNCYLDTVSEAEDKVFLHLTKLLQAVAMHLDSDFLQIFEVDASSDGSHVHAPSRTIVCAASEIRQSYYRNDPVRQETSGTQHHSSLLGNATILVFLQLHLLDPDRRQKVVGEDDPRLAIHHMGLMRCTPCCHGSRADRGRTVPSAHGKWLARMAIHQMGLMRHI